MFNMFLQVPRCGVVKSLCLLGLEETLCLTMMCLHRRQPSTLPTPGITRLVLIRCGLLAAATHQLNASSNVRRMTFCLS